ncbi:hypothetical protein [Bowmanella denitrificans]|uniref:hypothetical protein n=1 Tax=Bowmanella denitrificans TaxID=366582 RepID=UPI000C9CEEDE|nr:hypothetical protein [Bowmanella denitrificans]
MKPELTELIRQEIGYVADDAPCCANCKHHKLAVGDRAGQFVSHCHVSGLGPLRVQERGVCKLFTPAKRNTTQ